MISKLVDELILITSFFIATRHEFFLTIKTLHERFVKDKGLVATDEGEDQDSNADLYAAQVRQNSEKTNALHANITVDCALIQR